MSCPRERRAFEEPALRQSTRRDQPPLPPATTHQLSALLPLQQLLDCNAEGLEKGSELFRERVPAPKMSVA